MPLETAGKATELQPRLAGALEGVCEGADELRFLVAFSLSRTYCVDYALERKPARRGDDGRAGGQYALFSG